MGEFLSRPLKIKQYQWRPGTQLFEKFNPWELFFGNADVRDKINRFRNLRCRLCLKILINGNSFYYGRALVSYNPYTINDNVTKDRGFFIQDLIAASNKPHILLDPCTSEGGHMCLPFIWPENYLDITQPNWSSFMGECTIHDFALLRHANGGTDPITVSIFAWAEDVSLLIPTTATVQSGKGAPVKLDKFGFAQPFTQQARSNMSSNDEFSTNGLISKPASAVAKAANALSMVPYVAPYAKATSMVASKLGAIARIFGYSRPQIMSDTHSYVPHICGNLVNSDAPENISKLSLDSKNELSIDTRTMGLGGTDELTIHSIASRMTYWKQFSWSESAISDTLLASMSVQPFCVDTINVDPLQEIHSTALAFASCPFEAWQGSIKFHFKVVCSEYHRGRLRLVYNPVATTANPVAFNQVYSTTIDITNDREFDYECKWTDVRAWNLCLGVPQASTSNIFSTVQSAMGGTDYDNGTLSVYVVNELATPSTTNASVNVQVWVSAGDDFALSVPGSNISNLSYFQQQATPDDALAVISDNSNNPVGGNPIENYGTEHAPLIHDDNQYLVYQGERIVSFKDLLRRYQYHTSYFPPKTGNGHRYYALTVPGMPLYRGWDPNGTDQAIDSTTGNSNYNFCSMTLLNYLAPAFVCQRGSIRHKWVYAGTISDDNVALLSVTRNTMKQDNGVSETSYSLDASNPGTVRTELLNMQRATLTGTAVTPVHLNNTLQIELPYYSKGQRFRPARYLNMAGNGDNQSVEIACEISTKTVEAYARLDQFVSIGEDFTFGMFVGAPIMYSYGNPIAS